MSQITADGPEVTEQAGSLPSFADLFHEYRLPIYNYLLRMTQNRAQAEDLTQEAVIRVHRGLPAFRGESSLSTWIYRIATNLGLDHLRRRASQQAAAALSLDEAESEREQITDPAPYSPEQLAAHSEMSDCVQRFVWNLPPDHRAVLMLHDLQELKNREIADVVGCSLATVKIRLHRARAKLREALREGCALSYDERGVFVCEETSPSEKDAL